MATREEHLQRARPPKRQRLEALGVKALRPGEAADNFRIRGPKALIERIATMTPTERGVAMARGLDASGE